MSEEWRKIPEFPDYSVSRDGVVRNDHFGRVLRGARGGTDFTLYRDGKDHRLHKDTIMSMAFGIPKSPRRGVCTAITDEQVVELLRLRAEGMSLSRVARIFGIDQSHVSRISRGKARRVS